MTTSRKPTAKMLILQRTKSKLPMPLTQEEAWILARGKDKAFRDFGIHRLVTLANTNDDDNLWQEIGKFLQNELKDSCSVGVLERFSELCSFHGWSMWAGPLASNILNTLRTPAQPAAIH